MYYKHILPYNLCKQMLDMGWLSDENNVYIPLPCSTENNKHYLKINRDGNYLHYFLIVDAGTENEDISPVASRCNLLKYDIYELGDNLRPGPYDDLIIVNSSYLSEEIYTYIRGPLKDVWPDISEEKIKEFLHSILKTINSSDCLDILVSENYENLYEKFLEEQGKMAYQFKIRKHVGKARQRLARWLKTRFDVILRKNTHDIYIIDDENNCYTEITKDELMVKISKILGPELINDDDLKWSLSYISDRLDPKHDIVKFENCVYNMDTLEIITNNNPVFTLVETKYRYNPNAESIILKEFLYSSLKKDSAEDTEKIVQGVKEVIGYLFTSGNRLNLLPMITGISGGGKSVFANILTAIFGKDKIADLKLQEIEKNTHATSSLINKHLNIIQDSDNSTINNNSLIKQITGNDPLQVNPKHADPFVLPKEEVPKTIIICNNIPIFKRLEPALIERILIIEFNVKFRGTDKEDPHLLDKILANSEEMEWLIFESLNAYKKMVQNKEDFTLRKSGEVTRTLVDKHQNPVNFIFNQLIESYKSDDSKIENRVYSRDLNNTIIHLADKQGVDLTLNRKGEVSKKHILDVIRYELDLWDMNYGTSTDNGRRYYPNLKPTELYSKILEEISTVGDEN